MKDDSESFRLRYRRQCVIMGRAALQYSTDVSTVPLQPALTATQSCVPNKGHIK